LKVNIQSSKSIRICRRCVALALAVENKIKTKSLLFLDTESEAESIRSQ
jgi:hypothetical protein